MAKKILIVLGIAILVALLSVLIQMIPSVSSLLEWLEQRQLTWVWYSCVSAIIAVCEVIYLKKSN